jgi:hypothetical protein
VNLLTKAISMSADHGAKVWIWLKIDNMGTTNKRSEMERRMTRKENELIRGVPRDEPFIDELHELRENRYD